MPIPIIPIVAALGAGAIGYYIGRKTAGHSMEDSSTSVFLCGDFGNANKEEMEDAEAPAGTQPPEEEIDEDPRGT